MRQAGRYLPEYRAVAGTLRLSDHLPDAGACVRVDAAAGAPARRGRGDPVLGHPRPACRGWGVDVVFTPAPHLDRPLRSRAAVESLQVPDPREAMPYVLDAIRAVKSELPREVPLIGFAGAPFTMATYMVEGRRIQVVLGHQGPALGTIRDGASAAGEMRRHRRRAISPRRSRRAPRRSCCSTRGPASSRRPIMPSSPPATRGACSSG